MINIRESVGSLAKHQRMSSGTDPELISKLEAVMEQAVVLNPELQKEFATKSVHDMTPEEMIDRLNFCIKKTQDDVSDARSRKENKS